MCELKIMAMLLDFAWKSQGKLPGRGGAEAEP